MAEQSGFFDAHASVDESGNVVYDRTYLAESFAKYFASFVGNGIFGGKSSELMVRQKESADMSVRVLAGQAFINGYFYENTDELSLSIDNADGVLNRIDLIVLRWDKYERTIRVVVEKGSYASLPSAPMLKRNDDYYELELAKVNVKAGAVRITQADIIDARLDSDVCGFVVGVIKQFDTAEFNAHLNAWIDELKIDSIDKVNELLSLLEEIVSTNDLSPILSEIQILKDLSIESPEYPGCYYRVVNGEVEWLNPPAEPGIEYRLVDRFEGKTIFQTLINIASLPNTSRAAIATNFTFTKVLSCEGVMLSGPSILYAEARPFPVFLENGVSPVAMIHGITTGITGRFINVSTTMDLSDYRANVVIKYVK